MLYYVISYYIVSPRGEVLPAAEEAIWGLDRVARPVSHVSTQRFLLKHFQCQFMFATFSCCPSKKDLEGRSGKMKSISKVAHKWDASVVYVRIPLFGSPLGGRRDIFFVRPPWTCSGTATRSRRPTILYYTKLAYAILYYTILDYTILYCNILYCNLLYHTIPYHTIPYYNIL